MPVRMKVELEGYPELMRKLRSSDELLGAPWRHAMDRVAEIGVQAGRAAAPVATGRLRAKISGKVQAKPVPKWARVKATARAVGGRRHKGYRYPARLEYDPKSRHRGWLRNSIKRAWGRVQGALQGAAREIESNWSR